MNKGKLTFKGTIDLTQFWPQNIKSGNNFDSDADTVKVKLDANSVTFTSGAGNVKQTKVMNIAGFFHNVTSKTKPPVLKFKSVLDAKGNINMRLQGIDAPELHYNTGTPLFRQQMGETATIQLYNFLKSNTTGNSIRCEVFTQVDVPNDIFDKYGRCVGDIVVKNKKGVSININHWLVEKGWAFPAYYNSMTPKEIRDINVLANKASKSKLNIWKFFSVNMAALDVKLIHNKKNPNYSAAADKKPPVIFPKLYRRLWTFQIQNQTPFTTAGYQKFLAAQKDDRCCKTAVFLKSGYPKRSPLLASFVAANGTINFKPADIVFKEGGTTLKDNKGNKITTF